MFQLVEQIEDSQSANQRERNGRKAEVVLRVRVEDTQYTLTRMPLQPPRPKTHLSPREKEIVRLVAKGYPNKTIAAVLEISPWTVATHLRRIFGKLGVSSRTEMVARVLKEGLLESQP